MDVFSYLLTMVLANLTYTLIERPFLKLKDRISASKTTVAFSSKDAILEGTTIPRALKEDLTVITRLIFEETHHEIFAIKSSIIRSVIPQMT